MIHFDSVRFSYGGGAILDGFDLVVEPGEIVCLLGPSGCGKSTVLRIAAGLEKAEGWIEVETPPAFVFQDAALMPWASVFDNVALPLVMKGDVSAGHVYAALDAVGLAHFGDRYPATLSGGQMMRVSIARALVAGNALVLMDEPFAAVDEIRRHKLNDLIMRLRDERGLTVLFVTHSLYEAAYMADKVAVMHEGRVASLCAPSIPRGLRGLERRAHPGFQKSLLSLEATLSEARP